MLTKRKSFDIVRRIFDHAKLQIPHSLKKISPNVSVGGLRRGPQQETTSTTVIKAKTVFKGDVSGEDNLRIDGKFEGLVNLLSDDVTIGEAGQVTADITAKIVTVDGHIEGEIKGCEKVIISKTGRMQGKVSGPIVILEEGAKFTGCIDMNPAEVEKVTNAAKSPVKAKSVKKSDDQAETTS